MGDIDIIRGALDFHKPGREITSDDLRAAIDAAQIPGNLIGPLMGRAVAAGWLHPTGRWRTSRRRSRKHSYLREYLITDSKEWAA